MLPVASVALALLLAGIAALHVYWALGGAWGGSAVVPTRPVSEAKQVSEPAFRPGPAATLAVAALLGTASLVPLAASRLVTLPVPSGFVRAGIWMLAAVLLLRSVGDFRYVGLTKRVRGTPFAVLDTQLYTPLCLVLSALALVVALEPR